MMMIPKKCINSLKRVSIFMNINTDPTLIAKKDKRARSLVHRFADQVANKTTRQEYDTGTGIGLRTNITRTRDVDFSIPQLVSGETGMMIMPCGWTIRHLSHRVPEPC